MKKILLLAMCVILAFSFAGCIETEETKELLSYVNDDLAELEEYEAAVIDSFNSVSGDNYTDDATMYEELSTNTMSALEDWEAKIIEVQEGLKDSKILEVHALYSSYATKWRNSIVTMMDALETGDIAKATSANDMMDEANKIAAEFRTKLDELGEEYNVEITRE